MIDETLIDDVIRSQYEERDRLGWYHGKRHVEQVRRLIWQWNEDPWSGINKDDLESLDMAAVYHDAVYVPGDRDNEENSAALAMTELNGKLDERRLEDVRRLILSTRFPEAISEHGEADGTDVWRAMRDMLHDADWYNFHCLDAVLDAEPGIMAEIRWRLMSINETGIPMKSFMGRRQWLDNLLELLDGGHPMFRTHRMSVYNKQAVENVRYMIRMYDRMIEGN